jgi:hypothetical protein
VQIFLVIGKVVVDSGYAKGRIPKKENVTSLSIKANMTFLVLLITFANVNCKSKASISSYI